MTPVLAAPRSCAVRPTRNEGPVPEDETLMTKQEVASLFRVDVATISRWVRTGRLTAVRVGGTVRFSRPYIRTLIEAEGAPNDAA